MMNIPFMCTIEVIFITMYNIGEGSASCTCRGSHHSPQGLPSTPPSRQYMHSLYKMYMSQIFRSNSCKTVSKIKYQQNSTIKPHQLLLSQMVGAHCLTGTRAPSMPAHLQAMPETEDKDCGGI